MGSSTVLRYSHSVPSYRLGSLDSKLKIGAEDVYLSENLWQYLHVQMHVCKNTQHLNTYHSVSGIMRTHLCRRGRLVLSVALTPASLP